MIHHSFNVDSKMIQYENPETAVTWSIPKKAGSAIIGLKGRTIKEKGEYYKILKVFLQ